MAKCYFCGTDLQKKNGNSKIWTPINDKDVAVVEVDSPLFCCECKEHYLTTEQLIDGFEQICNTLEADKKNIEKGIYS